MEDKKLLNDKELDKVSGGTIDLSPYSKKPATTQMNCSNCGRVSYWRGDYVGQTFQCPNCGEDTFTGISCNVN